MNLKHTVVLAALLAMTGLYGCETRPRGGGLARQDSFDLIVPHTPLELKQGAVHTVDVSLMRGDLFKQDVKLDVKATPGINVDPTNMTVKASARPDSQVRIAAARDAALGEYRVTVTATPANGQPTLAEFRVNVIAQ